MTIARASISLTYPARFMLVAAMNPCPCGYWGSHGRECRCGTHQMQRYRGRISRSILDRIDLHIEVPAVGYEDLHSTTPAEPSAAIRERVVAARIRQLDRFSGDGIYANALMKPRHIKKYCHLDGADEQLLAGAVRQLGLSARAYQRILKVYSIRLRTFILLVSCLLGFVATQPSLQFSPLYLEMKDSNL